MQTVCDYLNLQVLYQDEYLVAVHKPAGLLVHRSAIDKHETYFALQMTRDLIGQQVYPVHRLDKPTSGILLFALDSDTARMIGEQFMQHSIQKTYLAICRGWADTSGEINKPLKYQKDKLADKDKQAEEVYQTALTLYKTLDTASIKHKIGKFDEQRYSLIKLSPKTGRKHQLRRHLSHINHPIIGDVGHGDRHHNHFFNDLLGQHRLYLAATKIVFTHPYTNKTIAIEAPLENSFSLAMSKLNLEY